MDLFTEVYLNPIYFVCFFACRSYFLSLPQVKEPVNHIKTSHSLLIFQSGLCNKKKKISFIPLFFPITLNLAVITFIPLSESSVVIVLLRIRAYPRAHTWLYVLLYMYMFKHVHVYLYVLVH